MFFELLGDISFGLRGPLRTAFDLQIDLKTSTNQPDATALTENAINWLKPSFSFLNFYTNSKFSKIANLGAR